MFRSDAREEQATANTGAAFEAVKAAAQAGAPATEQADHMLAPGETAQAEEAK